MNNNTTATMPIEEYNRLKDFEKSVKTIRKEVDDEKEKLKIHLKLLETKAKNYDKVCEKLESTKLGRKFLDSVESQWYKKYIKK